MTKWPHTIRCLGSDDIMCLAIESFVTEDVDTKDFSGNSQWIFGFAMDSWIHATLCSKNVTSRRLHFLSMMFLLLQWDVHPRAEGRPGQGKFGGTSRANAQAQVKGSSTSHKDRGMRSANKHDDFSIFFNAWHARLKGRK